MKIKTTSGVIILLLLFLVSLSCIQTDALHTCAEVSVIEKELMSDSSGRTVLVITVKNTGRVKADFAEVNVRFYDTGKNLIDSSRDSIMTLNPGETWEFAIPCNRHISKVASYEIETTSGTSKEGL